MSGHRALRGFIEGVAYLALLAGIFAAVYGCEALLHAAGWVR